MREHTSGHSRVRVGVRAVLGLGPGVSAVHLPLTYYLLVKVQGRSRGRGQAVRTCERPLAPHWVELAGLVLGVDGAWVRVRVRVRVGVGVRVRVRVRVRARLGLELGFIKPAAFGPRPPNMRSPGDRPASSSLRSRAFTEASPSGVVVGLRVGLELGLGLGLGPGLGLGVGLGLQ